MSELEPYVHTPAVSGKFYTFRQNNSGGVYIGPICLIVEAHDAEQANSIAEGLGAYFDGVEEGSDCDCCGDRWARVEDEWGDGDPVPSVYGQPVEFAAEKTRREVHYLDGSVRYIAVS